VKRNYIIGAVITAVILSLFIMIFRHFFEIVSAIKYVPPSREARVNEYLALDRWLTGMGISVRVETTGDLFMVSYAKEKKVFIQASLFDWEDGAANYLARWVEDGGTLLMVLDNTVLWQEKEPIILLEKFGISAEEILPRRNYRNSKDENATEHRNGVTRFEQAKRGRGKIVALADSDFMRSSSLDDEPNICLAWALFASEPDSVESGWLFIRGKTRVRGLLGTIFRQGNFAVFLVSILVLLAVCFWAVIPGFGLVKWDDEKPSRPLRERFLAEGRFLKKYGALDFYSQAYVREIKRRLAMREGIIGDEESLRRALEIYGAVQNEYFTTENCCPSDSLEFHGEKENFRIKTPCYSVYSVVNSYLLDTSYEKPEDEKGRGLLVKAFNKEPFTFKEFQELINAFKTVLERI
jgi:hypothetical protein